MNFLSDIRPGPESLPDGDYAMWIPSDQEPQFTSSESRENLRRLYSAVRGIETYIYGAILGRIANLKGIGTPTDEDCFRVALPSDLTIISLATPDGQVFAFSACKEKGLRFHFHQTARSDFRNLILVSFSTFAEAMGRVYKLAGYPPDEAEEESPEKWWAFCDQVITDKETTEGEPINAVGTLVLGGNTLAPPTPPLPKKPWWKFW